MIKKTIIYLTSIIFSLGLVAQNPTTEDDVIGRDDSSPNTITTAVPFLLIAPESRGGAMGDAGVATSPDVNSMHYNPAKYAFIKNDFGVAISYSPWLRELVPDINLAYVSGYKRIDRQQVIGASLRYFSLGSITFTNNTGQTLRDFTPNEFAIDGAYSRLFSEHISGSVALRYIYSNLTGGAEVGGAASHPGHSFASDVSVYYENELEIDGKDADLGIGLNISNIGRKISYTQNADKDFIPINMKLGAALNTHLDDYNALMVTAEMNKLMVPTPPIYDVEGNEIIAGEDPEVSVPVGMFRSFWDAPGVSENGELNRFKEEMREVNLAFGMEYWYSGQFALRGGYFHEHMTKGNRKFFTIGLGLKLTVFSMDFSYLIPVKQNNPLANTLRFTLIFDFEGLKGEANPEPLKE